MNEWMIEMADKDGWVYKIHVQIPEGEGDAGTAWTQATKTVGRLTYIDGFRMVSIQAGKLTAMGWQKKD